MAALELALDPTDAARLQRVPELAKLRGGRARRTAVELTWYDTPEGVLAAGGLSLCERRIGRETRWRLERLRGGPGHPWPAGAPPPVVAEAPQPSDLPDLPAPLLPVAAFSGALQGFPLASGATALQVSLLQGALRAVPGERPACRLLLDGPPEQLEPLARALAAAVGLQVPAEALAAQGQALAGRQLPAPAHGAPQLPAGIPVADAFALVAGHLAIVLLHVGPLALVGETPEPVHQMRVALRRLRSAISLFRRAVGGPDLAAADAELRALAQVLGPARDWDVFTAGTGRAVGECFTDERAVRRLLAAAERQRRAAYTALAAFLQSPAFRLLGLRLACLIALRPWEQAGPPDDDAKAKQAAMRDLPLAEFAARMLDHRLKRLLESGHDLADLPPAELHKVRIQAKRLRYAAEFFTPLFPRKETRQFIRRVERLQEQLGLVNDSRVADALMAQFGSSGSERTLAIGMVRGFVAAGAARARTKSERSWRRLRRLEPFWK